MAREARTDRHSGHRRRPGGPVGRLSPRERGLPFVILDADARIGDHWRNRWDSLRLYSPARYDSLPGMRFPAPSSHWPTGREMADYLEAYARRFDLPVRSGTRVERVEPVDGGFIVSTADGERLAARQVVVATGPFRQPNIPAFAAELDPSIRQLHSHEYRNPAQLSEGPSSSSGCRTPAPTSRSRPPTPATGRSCPASRMARCRSRSPIRSARCSAGRSSSSCSGTCSRCARRWGGGCARGPQGRRPAPPGPPR